MRKVQFITGRIYHIYNRGTDKRLIFLDRDDYLRWNSLLYHFARFDYPFSLLNRRLKQIRFSSSVSPASLREEMEKHYCLKPRPVDILFHCSMPNHYHLGLRQTRENGISYFMHKVGIGYSTYFNIRHERSGRLFEGTFKAKPVESDEQLIYLSWYIHVNPSTAGIVKLSELDSFSWSSLPVYLGKRKPFVCNPELVLGLFGNSKEKYKKFIFGSPESEHKRCLRGVCIDDDFGWYKEEKEKKERRRREFVKVLSEQL